MKQEAALLPKGASRLPYQHLKLSGCPSLFSSWLYFRSQLSSGKVYSPLPDICMSRRVELFTVFCMAKCQHLRTAPYCLQLFQSRETEGKKTEKRKTTLGRKWRIEKYVLFFRKRSQCSFLLYTHIYGDASWLLAFIFKQYYSIVSYRTLYYLKHNILSLL